MIIDNSQRLETIVTSELQKEKKRKPAMGGFELSQPLTENEEKEEKHHKKAQLLLKKKDKNKKIIYIYIYISAKRRQGSSCLQASTRSLKK
jgi:hypothetical protein